MSLKAVLKTIWFLALFFVVLYVGMNNPQVISFNFPVAGTTAKDPIHASAAVIFFGVFAIGVFAGMALHIGGGGNGAKKKAGK
ncbi:MAG: hypothetical protein JWM32_99 [Verrucomicrobia bacterium]|nr:hypothetical protein [Verrucomicrobiota bacterium]